MAQMTVAAALGEQPPDHWEHHLVDTLAAGRGLCDESLSALVCEDGPRRIREMEEWKVGWAREDGHIKQAHAPGHDRPRCVYVDFLSTGPAVSKTLRTQLNTTSGIRRIGDLTVVDIAIHDGVGVVRRLHVPTGETVTLAAKSVVIATGGLTRLYRRNSASSNMGGDGYALALRAGAELIDMEFVQFFPIGHLAPRLVGMDPIMWDPFRYKLGGRLLNSEMVEFEDSYARRDTRSDGQNVLRATSRPTQYRRRSKPVVESPAAAPYLSFQHLPEAEHRRAFGPVVDRLAANGIDLTRQPVEVAPIAHYHMGGIRVDGTLQTGVPGLFACGEAVGGANGANRLSGNAITEAFVFGRAGRGQRRQARVTQQVHLVGAGRTRDGGFATSRGAARDLQHRAKTIADLQSLMSDKVGPFRTGTGLSEAAVTLAEMTTLIGDTPVSSVDSLRYCFGRLARSSGHVAGRTVRRSTGADAHREPRRAPARRSSWHG